MCICIYKDQLIPLGLATEEQCDEGNLVDIDVPEDLLHEWFKRKIEPDVDYGFDRWYKEESVADDMDGFLNWSEFVPNKEMMYVYLF